MGWIRKHSDALSTALGVFGAVGNTAIDLSQTGHVSTTTAIISLVMAGIGYLSNKLPHQ